MFPFYNDFAGINPEQAMPGRMLPRASSVVSGNNGVTQDVSPGSALGGYEQQAARLLEQSQDAIRRLREIRDRPVDYSQLQELAKQRGMEGENAMLNALAAQFAGPQYEGLQGTLLRRSMAAREPVKTARGMVTAEGGFIADPDALRGDELQRAQEDAQFYDQQYGRVLTAAQQAELRRDQMRRDDQRREEDRGFRREMFNATLANRQPPAVQTATIMVDGKPTVVDARTRSVIGEAPPKDGGTGKALPSSSLTKLSELGTAAQNMNRISDTFRDSFGGYMAGALGSAANLLGRNVGMGFDDQAKWWQDYQMEKNVVRNRLFGSALTATETAEWEKAAISPGMTPSAIRTNLERQRLAALSAAAKLASSYAVQGYNQDAIEQAIGIPLSELRQGAQQFANLGRINPDQRLQNPVPAGVLPPVGQIEAQSQPAAGSPMLPTMDALDAELRRRQTGGR